MLVEERMSRHLATVDPGTTVSEAIGTMRRLDVRHLVVVVDGALVGILSDRDLTRLPPDVELVAQVMSAPVITVLPEAGVDDAAHMIRRNGIDALPVVDRDGQLLGIITTADVLDAFIDLSGLEGPSYLLMLDCAGMKDPELLAHQIVGRHGGQLRWMEFVTRWKPPRLRIRVAVADVNEIADALETAGFTISGLVGDSKVRPDPPPG